MITLEPDYTRGAVRIFGPVPNGAMVVTRQVAGMPDVLVRGGAYTVTARGVILLDTEAPYSEWIHYRIGVSGISPTERLVQQNLMLTPTFNHGVQGWLPGTGRALAVSTDSSAHSPVVGHVGPGTPVGPSAAPTYVGHTESGVSVNSTYTLTPPTAGGTAIATNDQMILVHQQLSTVATPAAPAGWTQIALRSGGGITRVIWSRRRLAGDAGIAVAALSGSNSAATLLWVRGAIAEVLAGAELPLLAVAGQTAVTTARKTALRGHLTVGVVDAVVTTAQALPAAGAVSGGPIFRYSQGQASGTRSFTIATSTDALAGDSIPTTVTYGSALTAGGGIDIVFQAAGALPGRVIARGKLAALPAAPDPYLLTGRVRYVTLGLWTWADVKAQGSWQNLKDTKTTWLDVRGGDSTIGGIFAKLFLRVVDPVTDIDYVPPVQVLVGADDQVNTWIDFSAQIQANTDIPATAEIQLLHGAEAKEYSTDWYLDEFGITPGEHLQTHNTLYWFDGDTALPSNTEDMLFPDGSWSAVTNDASVAWTGVVGNSVSALYAPSSMSTTSVTWLTLPEDVRVPSEPVLLSDPLDMNLWCWVGLLQVGDLTHPARQAVFQIINRPDPVANSQVRTWETGELQVITHTLQERARFLSIVSSGRVLILRNPHTEYPENNWYLAIGDITESRLIPNHRKYERAWTLPFVRVKQPVSIAARTPIRNTWQDVRGVGTWNQVRARWDSWQDVLVDEA